MMKGLPRWIAIALGALVALGIIAFGVVYVLSERILRRLRGPRGGRVDPDRSGCDHRGA